MDRLTVPDEPIEGGMRRAIIDAREVRKEAMKVYWALKKYEDTGLTPAEIDRLIQAMELVNAIIKKLDLPELQQDWIPVSERLPEEPQSGSDIQEYIVTIYGADQSTTLSYIGRDQWRDDDGNWYKVLAWMPMPESYKPELSRLMGAGERRKI
ncbi:MAG: DUF551 domain-containing protein [Faecalicatena sp.]|uniref:DUF551 domain-containing protein n=1 Tax=Faecalicatena sp. TaxID=2005360 RepID=UPI002589463F|nr:DUF551 domain-containing protein [Faecalicatena sp.]MCI6467052.1 DUF551 domain-containing protein [Faecalicatena sp.]MDY5617469.1 DUF551 domain-containing protein [Lachnospiraceae bacterium]